MAVPFGLTLCLREILSYSMQNHIVDKKRTKNTMRWYWMPDEKFPPMKASYYNDWKSFTASIMITLLVRATNLKLWLTNKTDAAITTHYEDHVHNIWHILLVTILASFNRLFTKYYPLGNPVYNRYNNLLYASWNQIEITAMKTQNLFNKRNKYT